jgi:hypothetical protein
MFPECSLLHQAPVNYSATTCADDAAWEKGFLHITERAGGTITQVVCSLNVHSTFPECSLNVP